MERSSFNYLTSSLHTLLFYSDTGNTNRLYCLCSCSRYRTGTSLQLKIMQGSFQIQMTLNDIRSHEPHLPASSSPIPRIWHLLFLMIFHHMSLTCKLVLVQYRAYDVNLLLMIFHHMSLHCKLVPVQYRAYDINLFLMIFPRMNLTCKLTPVQYREYDINFFHDCKLVPVKYREH